MERPATASSATAREIILEVVRNMREGLEPLHFSTLAPTIYDVYLHPTDLERLRGIVPQIVDEARRALDAELESLNRASFAERLKLSRRTEPKIAPPEGGWRIRILENTDDDVNPGDIVIYSELAMPGKPDFGAGAMTKRISTRRMGGSQTSAKQVYEQAPPAPAAAEPPGKEEAAPAPEPAPAGAHAVIEYEDKGGRKTYYMTKDEIVVGRGGRDYWTDLKLDTVPDVSREHVRLRRDPASGKFFLKDLSSLGMTIDGVKAPSSIDSSEGAKRDLNVEAPLPDKARIGLADAVFLDFRSTSNG
jgi:hypothetical protein